MIYADAVMAGEDIDLAVMQCKGKTNGYIPACSSEDFPRRVTCNKIMFDIGFPYFPCTFYQEAGERVRIRCAGPRNSKCLYKTSKRYS